MGLKRFNEDLVIAKAAHMTGISEIRRGDSDGEIVFALSHDSLSSSLDIRVLILDVESYPQSSSFMIFTESDCSTANISSFLAQLSSSLRGKDVQALIKSIANKLTIKLESSSTVDENTDSDVSSDPEDDNEIAIDYDDDAFDDYSFLKDTSRTSGIGGKTDASSAKRLKKDLRVAQSAGISVGVLPRGRVQQADIISLSIRVTKLGIPDDALEAWDLKAHEHLVLLCRFPVGYPTLSDVLEAPYDEDNPQFRFGKCARSKPSLETARNAFMINPDEATGEHDGSVRRESNEFEDRDNSFISLYMSNSINMLLNNEFFKLLKIRRADMIPWDMALDREISMARREHHPCQTSDNPLHPNVSREEIHDVPVSENALPPLQHDFALDDEADFSLPMVAMQFALRRLARCTKYCMVCHRKMEDGFEALKPYVCSSPLCLYQYMTLGLGSSIEHEVIQNPYVVDILISFFYAALGNTNSLREYPSGLNLKSFSTGSNDEPAEHITAEVCFAENSIRFHPNDYNKYYTIKVGASVLVVVDGKDTTSTGSMTTGGIERHICRVTNISNCTFTFERLASSFSSLNLMSFLEHEESTELLNHKAEWIRVLIFQCIHDIDQFDLADRYMALDMITRGIPSVLEMRAYLLNNPGQRLSTWNRIDKNSLTLLHWIIASNRSLILQDDAVPTLSATTERNGNGKSSESVAPSNPHRVQGLPAGWMQFRFLQGTPERERLFTQELQSPAHVKADRARFPTLFAWHGSGIKNWHSIIRTGLNFETKHNGRAFGNGVYLSNNFSVSSSYSEMYPLHVGSLLNNSTNMGGEWQNSQLRPRTAISLCEVINQTDKFVSTNPHYVVDKIEWIQCRYLFVAVSPTLEATKEPFPTRPTSDCVGYVEQSPLFKLLGARANEVDIPLSALSPNRRRTMVTARQGENESNQHGPSQRQKTPNELPDSDTDHDLLLDSDDELQDQAACRKRRRGSSPASVGQVSPKLSATTHCLKMPKDKTSIQFKTDFMPGALDLQSLPKLPEPTWASSSPAALHGLSRAINELQNIQSSEDIGSLGWYIDFNNLDNLFHWIVELHSFEPTLPLAQDMNQRGCTSIVLEFRFGSDFPYSPPFVRVIRPRFLPFAKGGGGHVTAGGAICSEMLTNSGWSAAMTIEKVLLQVRLGLCEHDPPARLDPFDRSDYGIGEAVSAYQRAARMHGWQIPNDLNHIQSAWASD